MSTTMRVYLGITEFDCPPEDVTRCLGVQPSETAVKGAPIPKTIMKEKCNAWQLDSGLKSLDLEKHVEAILAKVKSLDPLSKVTKSWTAEIVCVLYSDRGDQESETLCLSTDVVKKMASLGCGLSIDNY